MQVNGDDKKLMPIPIITYLLSESSKRDNTSPYRV